MKGDRLRRSGPELVLRGPLAELRGRMLADLEGRGFAGPTQKEFLELYRANPEAADMLQLLLAEGAAVRIPPDILLHGRMPEVLHGKVAEFFRRRPEMTVADLKEVVGVSRKQGVPLLEYLDRQLWTTRIGDVRGPGPKLEAS